MRAGSIQIHESLAIGFSGRRLVHPEADGLTVTTIPVAGKGKGLERAALAGKKSRLRYGS